jgi:hypothetical protein
MNQTTEKKKSVEVIVDKMGNLKELVLDQEIEYQMF